MDNGNERNGTALSADNVYYDADNQAGAEVTPEEGITGPRCWLVWVVPVDVGGRCVQVRGQVFPRAVVDRAAVRAAELHGCYIAYRFNAAPDLVAIAAVLAAGGSVVRTFDEQIEVVYDLRAVRS